MKQRRNNLDKEYFLEGNRQKWCAVYTLIGIIILVCTSLGFVHDPTPFMGYFTGIGVTFILGASATDVMKTYTISSQTYNQHTTEEVDIHEERLVMLKRLDSKDIDEEAFDEPKE